MPPADPVALRRRWRPWTLVAVVAGLSGAALLSTLSGASFSNGPSAENPVKSASLVPLPELRAAIDPEPQEQLRRQQLVLPQQAGQPGLVDDAITAKVKPATLTGDTARAPVDDMVTATATPATRSGETTRSRLRLPTPVVSVKPALATPEHDGLQLLVQSGDSLDRLFVKHGLNRADLARILQLAEARRHLQLLRPGDRIDVGHLEGQVESLVKVIDEERSLQITRSDDGFVATVIDNPVQRRQAYAHGVIDSSLFRAAQDAGISDTLIMNLAGIFAWDVDFVLDIRRGDSFTVVYEEIWQDGEKLRDGNILAAEFVNRGNSFRAVRFTDPAGDSGYFTPEGLSVRKAFLRAPIAITPRVTSNFNPRRLHPVHKRVRPHKGVDYGAPSGTPIKAAGDGKVIFRGRKGGYGNAVILQHGGNITTLYAHMSRFHKRARVGNRVRQGQVIGYVGATGTVTAAHLHYEYRVNGVHRNPRTVRLPKASPVASQYRDQFTVQAQPLLHQLDVLQDSIRVAHGLD